MANFDINFSLTNNKNHLFDLNTIPTNSDDLDSEYKDLRDEGDSVHVAEETYIENGDPVVRIITSSENTIRGEGDSVHTVEETYIESGYLIVRTITSSKNIIVIDLNVIWQKSLILK